MTETSNIRIRKTWLVCQLLAILEKDERRLAVVIPWHLGNRADIRFQITAAQADALRPYVAERRHIDIPVAVKTKTSSGDRIVSLSMLDYPVYDATGCARIVKHYFYDCLHPWTK